MHPRDRKTTQRKLAELIQMAIKESRSVGRFSGCVPSAVVSESSWSGMVVRGLVVGGIDSTVGNGLLLSFAFELSVKG